MAPVPIRAREEQPVKIGMVEPLTGVFAELAAAEVAGARLAIDEINQSGGILGREAQLLVADSANEIMTEVGQAVERNVMTQLGKSGLEVLKGSPFCVIW